MSRSALDGRLGSALRHVGIVLVYAAATVVLTWPLARDPWHTLPDPVGILGAVGWPYVMDVHHHAWGLSWLARALTTAPLALYDAPVFHPAPEALAYTEHFLGHAPVAVPTYLVSGNPVLTYNLVLLSCYLGCALSMHVLAWRWTGSHLAAFAAGLVYGFGARRLTPSFWLEYAGAIWMPFVPLLLERWADENRLRDLVGLSAALTMQTLCSYYLGYSAFLAAGATGLLLLWRGRLRPGAAALAIGAGVVAAGLVAAVSRPYLHLHAGGALPPVTMAHAAIGSLRPALLGPGGEWFLGWPAIVLALLGLLRRSPGGARGTALVLMATGFALALGPHVRLGGTTLSLPYRWLYEVVPGFSAVRFPVILLACAEVGFAALVALGAAAVAARVRPKRLAAAAAIGLALVVAWDLASRARVAVRRLPVGDALPAVYRALAAAPPGGAVLELPMGGRDDLRAFYRETHAMVLGTYHWRPLVNGYSDFAPPTYDLLSALARRLPERESLATLRDAGVRWLILHAATPPRGWAEAERAGAVRRVAADAGDVLYEIVLPPRRDLESRLRADLATPASESLEGTPLAPLPAGALRSAVQLQPMPPEVLAGASLRIGVTVRNESGVAWPGLGVRSAGLVTLELRWVGGHRDGSGRPDHVWRLPRDLGAGEALTLQGRIAAPPAPARYELEARLRQDVPAGPVADAARVPVTVAAPPLVPGRRSS
jgi:hypothetical protein